MMLRTALPVALAFSLIGCASSGSAPLVGTEPMTNEDVLVIYCAGTEGMLPDERDAGLREALLLLDDRLLELPSELGLEDVTVPVFELARDLLISPMSLRVDLGRGQGGSAAFPLHAQLTVLGSDEEVADLATRFSLFVGLVPFVEPASVPGREGLKTLETELGRAYFGEDEGRFVVSFGEPRSDPLGLGSLGLPRGVDADFAFKLDVAKIQGVIEAFLPMAGDDASAIRSQLELTGILSERPVSFVWASGNGADRRYVAARYANYAPVLESLGSLSREPISRRDLSLIPSDATLVSIGRSDPTMIVKMMENASRMSEGATDPFAMIAGLIGVNLRTEFLETLGKTTGFYMSDTSGGGGMASAVAFCAVDDEAQLARTIDKLSDLATGLARDATQGYAAIRRWDCDGARCWSLSFPGLPVPIELSIGLAGDYIFMTLTPQALLAAVGQANGRGDSILDNAGFRAAVGNTNDLMSVAFQDTPRLIHDGYGYASFLFSAVANGVRSRNGERGPDFVLPSYARLRAGARPSVLSTRIDGDDLVATGEMDRSVVANATAFLGTPFASLLPAAVMAAVLPAVIAKESASAEALRAIEVLEPDDATPEVPHEHEGHENHGEHGEHDEAGEHGREER